MIRAIILSRNKFASKIFFKFTIRSKNDKINNSGDQSKVSLPSQKNNTNEKSNENNTNEKSNDECRVISDLDEDLLHKLIESDFSERNKVMNKNESNENKYKLSISSANKFQKNSEFDKDLLNKVAKDNSFKNNNERKKSQSHSSLNSDLPKDLLDKVTLKNFKKSKVMNKKKQITLKEMDHVDKFNDKSYNHDIGNILKTIGYQENLHEFEENDYNLNELSDSKNINFLGKIDSSNRLNIFNKEEVDGWIVNDNEETYNIMDVVDSWEYKQLTLKPPQNQFDEWLMLTKDKKLWKFPIDNEQDSSELKVGFHEHVFPQQFLSGCLPKSGIVSQYMNLVILGLSQSPHLTVSKKKEHIKWYEEYLLSKLDEINIAVEKSKEQQIYEDSLRKNKI